MTKHFYIKLLFLIIIFLCFTFGVKAQSITDDVPIEQHVCVGADVTYTAFGFPGSTLKWYIATQYLTGKDVVVPDDGSNVSHSGFDYNSGTLNHNWDGVTYPAGSFYILQIEEISAAPAACPTGLVDPGLKVYVHAKPLIDQVSQTSSTCDGEKGTLTISVAATVPSALSLQYRLKNSGGTISQSFVTKNTTHTFLDVTQDNYTLEVLYVLSSDNAVEIKGSLQSQAVNVQPSADVPPLICFEASNHALGKTVSQSSTYPGGVASKAVDGNTDGVWSNNSVTHTGKDAQAWWQVDLGTEEVVDYVDVLRRTDCCTERLVNFYIMLSNTDLQSVSLTDALKDSSVESYYVSGDPGDLKRILTLGNTARYVKIQLTGTNYLSLAEVKVMGCTSKTKADVNVFAEIGSCEKVVTWNEPVAIDNCPNVTLTSTHNSGATFPVGTTTVTYTATDGAGQKTTESFNVIVTDNQEPVLADLVSKSKTICPSDGDEGNVPQTAVVTGLNLTADLYSDNCTDDSNLVIQYKIVLSDNTVVFDFGEKATGAVSTSDPSGYAFKEGTTTISFKIIDEATNESDIKSFTVTVSHKPNPGEIQF